MAGDVELELMQSHMAQKPVLRGEVGCACVARDVAPLVARTLCDDQAFLPIILGATLPAVPRSLGDRWLRRNGLAECMAAECGYALRVGANTHSNLMTSISLPLFSFLFFCPNDFFKDFSIFD